MTEFGYYFDDVHVREQANRFIQEKGYFLISAEEPIDRPITEGVDGFVNIPLVILGEATKEEFVAQCQLTGDRPHPFAKYFYKVTAE